LFDAAAMQAPLFRLALFFALFSATQADGNAIGNTMATISLNNLIYDAIIIIPSMKCERRCLPPQHVYEVALLHDQRGCTKKATFNPELMDNLGQHKRGQRVTGELNRANYWDGGPRCEVVDTDDCAPSYHYYAVFSNGCFTTANGTIEHYNTYTLEKLARTIDRAELVRLW
jgi:hypothetical protein